MKKLFYIFIIFPLLSHSQYVINGWEKEEDSYHYDTNIIKSYTQISIDRGNNAAQRMRHFYDINGELIKVYSFRYNSFENQLKDSIQNSVYWGSEVEFARSIDISYYKNGEIYFEESYTGWAWYLKKNFKGKFKSSLGNTFQPALNGVISNYTNGYDYVKQKQKSVLQAKTLFIHNQPIVREFYNNYKRIGPGYEVRVDGNNYNEYYNPFPNEYDIKPMVKLFFEDIFATNNFYGKPSDLITKLEKNKNTVYNNIVGMFESLDGDTLAQSYGIDNDNMVLI